jgi:hypothetical protein
LSTITRLTLNLHLLYLSAYVSDVVEIKHTTDAESALPQRVCMSYHPEG